MESHSKRQRLFQIVVSAMKEKEKSKGIESDLAWRFDDECFRYRMERPIWGDGS